MHEDLDLCDILEGFQPSPAAASLCDIQEQVYYNQDRFKCVLAARQAGKSWLDAAWLMGGKPGEVSLYGARTVSSARQIMLPTFAEMNHLFDLGLSVNRQDNTVTEPNGHVIRLAGIKDTAAAESLRGPKYRKIVIDEAGTFHDELLKYSIEAVLQPTLIHTNGSIILSGTPGEMPEGYFFDLCGDPSSGIIGTWPTFHWTILDNERIPHPERIVEDILHQNKWTRDHPTFRREWLAQWVADMGARIYHWTGEYEPIPQDGLTVMALDFGVVDHTSWTVVRQPKRPHAFVIRSESEPDLNMEQIAVKTRELIAEFRPNYIVADEGALGKGYAKTLREVYQISQIEAADRTHKRARIDTARGMLSNHTLHLCAGAQELEEEWQVLTWDAKKNDHHPRYKQDCADGLLYAISKILATEGYVEPEDDRREEDRIAEAMRIRAMNAANRRARGNRSL